MIPNVGTVEDAVGMAASTSMRNNTIKLAKLFMAETNHQSGCIFAFLLPSGLLLFGCIDGRLNLQWVYRVALGCETTYRASRSAETAPGPTQVNL